MFSQRRPAKLQPYSKEPLGPPEGVQDAAVVSLPEPDAVSEGRTGNLEWCSCRNCTTMEREVDCFCCRESAAAVAATDASCITGHPSFEAVCLNRDVLRVSLRSHRDRLNPRTDIHANSFPEDLPEGSGYERSEALFVFGVDNMNTNEVMKVFQSYNPNHLEWVNDQSCVIIWKNALDAKRALFALGKWELDRPVAATQAANSADGDTAMATEMKEEDGQSRQLISAPAPEPVVWRSTASGHNSRQLLLRIAKDGDRKHRGAARKSEFYRKYGNPHTGQAGAVSIDDLRTRAKKRRRSDSDSGEVVESSATVTQGADDEMQVDTKDARLTIEVPNTKDSAEDSDSDDNTETAEDTEDTAEEDNERHHLSMASRSELQMLTIKVEQDSDEEEERQQRLKQVRDEEAAEERRLRHRPPSPKRAKAVSAADAARLDNLQKMCITISVDRESEDRERRRKQREQDRLMEEQRQAILARRHQRLQEGRKPTLSSVVIMPNTTREPSRKPPASDFGEMSSAGIKTEGEHSSAVLAGSGDLRNRLKDRKRGADSGSGFKSHAPGSLTITCDFDDR